MGHSVIGNTQDFESCILGSSPSAPAKQKERNVMELSDEQIDTIAVNRGWKDYPNDSIEFGNTWHCDTERAPFGRIRDKKQFREHMRELAEEIQDFPEIITLINQTNCTSSK